MSMQSYIFSRYPFMVSDVLSANRVLQTGFRKVPAHTITQVHENAYTLSVLVPGLNDEDIDVTEHEQTLIVRFQTRDKGNGDSLEDQVHRVDNGLTPCLSDLKFQLDRFVRVSGAVLDKGILRIDLVREVPDALQPRRIPIAHAA